MKKRSVQRVRLVGVRDERRPGEGAHAVVLLLLLLLASPSWGQAEGVSGTYPLGTPWAHGTPDLFVTNKYWDGSQVFPISWGNQAYPGDGRQGGISLVGAFMDMALLRPINRIDQGGFESHMSFVKYYDGSPTGYESSVFNVQNRTANYVYDDQGNPIGPWLFSAVSVRPADYLGVSGLPPGVYRLDFYGTSSRPDSWNSGQYDIWYCPKMYLARFHVSYAGADVAGATIQPLAINGMFGNVGVKSWRPGVTDASGYVTLLVPTNGKLAVGVTVPTGFEGQGGQSVSGDGTGVSIDSPTDGVAVDGYSAGPGGVVQVEYQVTLRPGARPLLAIADASNANDQDPNFWVNLWKPSPSKLAQFSSERGWWESWGPFGLLGQLRYLWLAGTLPEGEARLAGLLWPVNGVLGQSFVDLRPQKVNNEASYTDGGRGSLGGSILSYLRVLLSVVTWGGFLFGLYRIFRPKVVVK